VNVQAISKDLQTVFVTAAQAGKGADLVMGAHDWIGNPVQNGTIDPLQLTEDTRLVRDAPPDTRLRATVSQVEALGAQIVVHFEVDAPKVVTEDTKLLEKDAHTEDVPTHAQGTKFVAAFAPRSRVRIGDEVEVVVDTERMHFFDPDTGAAIRD
jgi:ABC-type sugar transport system ATPase subunit